MRQDGTIPSNATSKPGSKQGSKAITKEEQKPCSAAASSMMVSEAESRLGSKQRSKPVKRQATGA